MLTASSSASTANIVYKRSQSTTTATYGGSDSSPRKRNGFWSFLQRCRSETFMNSSSKIGNFHESSKTTARPQQPTSQTENALMKTDLTETTTVGSSSSSSSSSLMTKRMNGGGSSHRNGIEVIVEEDGSPNVVVAAVTPSERKVSRSGSVGCGSRSFSGDFFERDTNGFGDCTLRRVESKREGHNNKGAEKQNKMAEDGSVRKTEIVIKQVVTMLTLWACVTVGLSSPAPLLTFYSPDGDIIDCVRRENQPAFQNPLLKNHTIQDPPYKYGGEYRWQIWHKNGTKCPEGAIPIRRLEENGTAGSNAGNRATQGHEYAFGYMENRPNIYGTQATMNVRHPHIEGSGEFSLCQIWLTSGSYLTNDLNTIEAGWQVYPGFYGDYRPRFFIYWTTDAYHKTGCYNLRCGAFIQTSRSVAVEGAIGPQVDLTIRIWKDQRLGSWWLGIVDDHGVLEPVGYWPTKLFTLQKKHAQRVKWGGEIVNENPSGRHTKTQMGSGYLPGSSTGEVAYIGNLEVALSENQFQPLEDLEVQADPPTAQRN